MFFHPAVGASGALMGLLGVLIAVTTKRGTMEAKALRSRLISWVVSVFLLGFFINADNVAHLGGLVTGFILGKFMTDRVPMNPGERNRAYVLGWLAGLATLASFVFMFLHYGDPVPWAR